MSVKSSVAISSSKRSGTGFGGLQGFSTGSSLIRSSIQPRSFSSYSLSSVRSAPRVSLGSGSSSMGYKSSFAAGGGSGSFALMSGGLGMNEKDAMQNLNQRLGTYLDQVRSLELNNSKLEKEIREFASARTIDCFDWSIYNSTVKPLQDQIINAVLQNSRISLEIDNARLAAEDFKNKWEAEQRLRLSVEMDIDGLHQLKDTYLQLQAGLVDEIAALEGEIAIMKKDHEEQLRVLRQQKTAEIDVEVDSAPSIDLSAKLQEMRETYAKLADQNKKDLDNWYQEQVQIQVTQTTQSNQACQGVKAELATYRQELLTLEAEYNSLLGSLKGLENNLMNVGSRYDMELQGLQCRIAQLEGELGQIRNNILQQTQEYQKLLNIKMLLETEIQQYRRLLNQSQSSVQSGSSSSSFLSGSGSQSGTGLSSSATTTKIITEKITRY
ncbi:keratin, type I cytoskeletal 14-like [Stegostoma tigrinum]|uniref:keratin, type I cytoskeletal 14-like n=1 Tax=Stegostoma tigrinum TaxID=3053191 RepID=UPI00202B9C21|nr:keratin, type I cytoskeletal 14-like [Stegostoma tigrinum]